MYQFDLKNLEQNLLGNLVVKIDGKALFSQSGTFVIKKYKRNSLIEGEINAEVSNFIDKPISLKNCIFKMEYK